MIQIYYFYLVWNFKAESTSGFNCHSERGQIPLWELCLTMSMIAPAGVWRKWMVSQCAQGNHRPRAEMENKWYLSDEQHSSKAWSYTLNSAHLWRAVWLPCRTAASSEELIIYCLLRDSVCQCCMTIRAACSTSSIDACHGLLSNVIPQDVHGQSVACNLIWSMYLHNLCSAKRTSAS